MATLTTAQLQTILNMAKGDLAKARKASDKTHTIGGIKGGGMADVVYLGKQEGYKIVRLGTLGATGYKPSETLIANATAAQAAAYIVDYLYDIRIG